MLEAPRPASIRRAICGYLVLLSLAQAALPPERRRALDDARPALADLAGAVGALAELAGATGPEAGPGAALPGLAGEAGEPPTSRTAS